MCVSWLTMQEDSVCGSLVLCSRAEHPGDRQECEGGDGCPSLHGTQAEQASWEPGSSRTKSRYCSREATPLSVYPRVIWISFYQVLIAHSQPLSIALCLVFSVLNVGREFSRWRLFACSLRCLPPDGATETSRQAMKILLFRLRRKWEWRNSCRLKNSILFGRTTLI